MSVKAGRPSSVEYKATAGVVAQRRAGMPTVVIRCDTCDRPTGVLVPGGLRAGESLICPWCGTDVDDLTYTDAGVLSADDLADTDQLGELTSGEEYANAPDIEQEWHLHGDGTPARGPRDPWGREPRRGVGPVGPSAPPTAPLIP